MNLFQTGNIHRQAMLGADDSLDQDNEKEDLKMELALLNTALKKLDPDFDFAPIINPLLSDQGPAMAVVPKLKKQIERMTKVRDDFLQTRAANIQGRMSLVPEPAGPLPVGPFLPNGPAQICYGPAQIQRLRAMRPARL